MENKTLCTLQSVGMSRKVYLSTVPRPGESIYIDGVTYRVFKVMHWISLNEVRLDLKLEKS
jgi:hypothetical protein